MGTEGRKSYQLNGSFHTRTQETMWLFTRGHGAQQSLFKGRAASVFEKSHSVAGRWQSGQCFMLYILYLWSATLVAPLVFPHPFTLRAFFCCWYMPAKLNFLTQIKCTRQSSKLRKRVQLYRCWFAALTSSCSPQPHTCTAPSASSHSMPHTRSSLLSEINQVCDEEEQTLSIRSSPDVSLKSPEQRLEQLPCPTPEQGQQLLLIFIAGKFCASNQQEQRFHLKASRVQDHKACRHFYP